MKIASHEKINVEFSAVSSIVTICGGDIRRAINSLQFIATELNSSAITFETVQKVKFFFYHSFLLKWKYAKEKIIDIIIKWKNLN